jgi:AraC-like DNA-binding protein
MLPAVRAFELADPEMFRLTAHSPADFRLVLRERGRFRGWCRRFSSADIVVACGGMSLMSTYTLGTSDDALFTLVEPRGAPASMQGEIFDAGVIALSKPESEVHWQFPGQARWWTVRFPLQRLTRASEILFGAPLLVEWQSTCFVRANASRWGRIIRGLSALVDLPGPSSSPGEYSAPASTLPDGLLQLLLTGFVSSDESQTATLPMADTVERRKRIVDGLVSIADSTAEPLSQLQVCERLEVSLRTLNFCSNAILGVSAGRYLRLRRLHDVYRRLRSGRSSSVTEAAMAHGFYELGRFAQDYRALFGERPSETLRREALPER